ncbi:MAG TPA: hypothetical protein VL098_15180 [Flavipsychrobacter sp.]|nr:hypothetical protein [Flavipsychrobacter sp.]
MQQRYPLNHPLFYVVMFCATVWFYTKAYITDVPGMHERTNWYHSHQNFVRYSQRFLFGILAIIFFYFLLQYGAAIRSVTGLQWLLIGSFPLIAILYYGVVGFLNLRNIGWLKPFWIGFTWAGMVNIYPVLFYDITHSIPTAVSPVTVLLFVKNLMFITVLCIMFDIKDYADDHNRQLKTFVVKKGLRYTIFYILIPLSMAGLCSFWLYSTLSHFSVQKIILNTIPFICMISVAYSMHRRKPILYYLFLIDGLMLLKAFCGSMAMVFFS